MGWHASPKRATLLSVHWLRGSLSNKAQRKQDSAAANNSVTSGCQPLKVSLSWLTLPGSCHDSFCQSLRSCTATKLIKSPPRM